MDRAKFQIFKKLTKKTELSIMWFDGVNSSASFMMSSFLNRYVDIMNKQCDIFTQKLFRCGPQNCIHHVVIMEGEG